MIAEERMQTILQRLEQRRTVSVASLCQATGASEATIRRDLSELDRQGKLCKVHGGATLPQNEFESQEPDVTVKAPQELMKVRIPTVTRAGTIMGTRM